MPIRYECDDARRRVVITIQGPFEPADFLAVIARWRGEDVGAYGMLYDLRGMTGEPTITDLRQLMSEAAELRQGEDRAAPSRCWRRPGPCTAGSAGTRHSAD